MLPSTDSTSLNRTTIPIVVGADDYGLSPGVSRGILALLSSGRLSATSAMTLSPLWPDHGPWLKPLLDHIDIGVHFTLTDQIPLAGLPSLAPAGRLPSLPALLMRAASGGLKTPKIQADITAELSRQLDAFERVLGRPPDFVDGHQHVHLLPGVRTALLTLLAQRYPRGTLWVRDCAEPVRQIWQRGIARPKTLFIASLATKFAAQATALGLRTNKGFRGIRRYAPSENFPAQMRQFLAPLQPGTLIMVHPAEPDAQLSRLDPLVGPRYDEMAYLASDAWPRDLAKAGGYLSRLQRVGKAL